MDKDLALSFLTAFVFSIVGVFAVYKLALRYKIMDLPNVRSSHDKPTPRGGGVGILVGIVAASIIYGMRTNDLIPEWPFWAGLLLVASVGFLDDVIGGVNLLFRLSVQLSSALLIFLYYGGLKRLPLPPPFNFSLGIFSFVISILWFLAVINFFNFMDGIDGLAGTQALITAATLAFLRHGELAWIGCVVAGSSLGFLLFNWQPAKLFMGDVGSYSLAYIFASIPFLPSSIACQNTTMLVGLSLWMFLSDATFTLIRRLVSGERIWEAHRSHLYQRLAKSGIPHSKVSLLIGAFSIMISVVAFYAYIGNSGFRWWFGFLTALALFLVELTLANFLEKKRKKPFKCL